MSDRTAAFEAALAQAFEQGRAFEAGLVALLTYPDLLAERYNVQHWGTDTDPGDEEDELHRIVSAVYAVLRVASQSEIADTERMAARATHG